jgi:sugar phosphate isomerase/epimerase
METALDRLSPEPASKKPQKFQAGFAPATAPTLESYWNNMEASARVGFQAIETDNSRLKLAQAYVNRTGEFKDKMAGLKLRLVGLNEAYSLLDPAKYRDIREENAIIGKFMQAVGGVYTGPYGPLTNDEVLIRQIAKLCDEEGKRLWETNGIRFCYHTHSSLGFRRLMDLTDRRYVFLNPDLAWLARGYSASGEVSPPADALDVCRAYISRVCAIHLKDYDPNYEFEYQGKHWKGGVVLPGKGVVNFPAVVDFLKEAEFTGFFLGEHVGIGTYDYVRTPDAVNAYPAFRDNMVNTLGLSLAVPAGF